MVVSPSAFDPDPIDALCAGDRRRAAVAKALRAMNSTFPRTDQGLVNAAARILAALNQDTDARTSAAGRLTSQQQIRALALECAVRYHANAQPRGPAVIGLATKFATYIETGEERNGDRE